MFKKILDFFKSTKIVKKVLLASAALSLPVFAQLAITENWYVWEIESRKSPYDQLAEVDFKRALKTDGLERCCNLKLAYKKKNTILNKLIDQIRSNQVSASPASTEHMFVDYVAIGTSYATPAKTDVLLGNELFRSAPDTLILNGDNGILAFLYVNTSTGNGASTTVAAGSWSITVFDVADATGIVTNDRIRVQLDTGFEFATVLSVATNEITLTAGTALSAAPNAAGGGTVIQSWGEAALFAGDATASVDTGTPLNRTLLEYAKDSSKEIIVEAQIIYTGV